MSNSAIGLTVNINTLVKDGWCVELETGMRGGELRSWVKLRHFERGHSHRTRSMPADLATALMSVMRQAGVEPWDPSDLETAVRHPDGMTKEDDKQFNRRWDATSDAWDDAAFVRDLSKK